MAFQGWTFAAAAPAPPPQRQTRFPVEAVVQLFLRFEAWQIAWTVSAVNISESGFLCLFPVTDPASAERAVDLESLVGAEPQVRLQIDHSIAELFAPVVWGTLVRCTREPLGLALAFEFTETDSHLIALLDHLAHAAAKTF